MLSSEEVIKRLREANVAEVSAHTRIPYGTLRKLVTGETSDPRSSTIDPLRSYFEQQQNQ